MPPDPYRVQGTLIHPSAPVPPGNKPESPYKVYKAHYCPIIVLSTTISKRSVKKAIILPVPTQAIHLGGFFGEKPEIEIGKSRKAYTTSIIGLS